MMKSSYESVCSEVGFLQRSTNIRYGYEIYNINQYQ